MNRFVTYILALIGCMALMSCGDDVGGGQNTVNIIFTLSMPDATDGTRASGEQEPTEDGTLMESAIDQGHLHVVFYDPNGQSIGEVEHLSLLKESATGYKVVGSMKLTDKDLGDNHEFMGKVMVYANVAGVDAKADYTSASISGLTYDYPSTDGYIPMWGVKKLVNVRLEAGKQIDLNVINLLRAEAKLQVYLRQDMIDNGYSLVKVSLSKYNTKGYCLPALENYKDLDDADNLVHDKYVHFYDSPNGANLDFTNQVAYVPEFQNIGKGDDAAVIHLTLKDKKGNDEDYSLKFVNYQDGAPTTTAFDLVRNHYYQYEVYKGDDGKVRVNLVVRKWHKETHEEIIM